VNISLSVSETGLFSGVDHFRFSSDRSSAASRKPVFGLAFHFRLLWGLVFGLPLPATVWKDLQSSVSRKMSNRI
jgi:hypothetical protein